MNLFFQEVKLVHLKVEVMKKSDLRSISKCQSKKLDFKNIKYAYLEVFIRKNVIIIFIKTLNHEFIFKKHVNLH